MENSSKIVHDRTEQIDWKTVERMYEEMSQCNNLREYFAKYDHRFIQFNLSSLLKSLIRESGYSKTDIIRETNIEKSYFYQILNGRRNPSRDKVVKISLTLGLCAGETQRLLIAADKSILYPRRKRDAAILCCINNKYSLHDTQITLHELGIDILE